MVKLGEIFKENDKTKIAVKIYNDDVIESMTLDEYIDYNINVLYKDCDSKTKSVITSRCKSHFRNGII